MACDCRGLTATSHPSRDGYSMAVIELIPKSLAARLITNAAVKTVRGNKLDAGMEADIRNRADTQYHPVVPARWVSTATQRRLSMRAFGSRASTACVLHMPRLCRRWVGGNTNSSVITIGEKAADLICKDARASFAPMFRTNEPTLQGSARPYRAGVLQDAERQRS